MIVEIAVSMLKSSKYCILIFIWFLYKSALRTKPRIASVRIYRWANSDDRIRTCNCICDPQASLPAASKCACPLLRLPISPHHQNLPVFPGCQIVSVSVIARIGNHPYGIAVTSRTWGSDASHALVFPSVVVTFPPSANPFIGGLD